MTVTTTSSSRSSSSSARSASGKERALELLRSGVADLLSSAGWREALAFRRRFHSYSFFNTALIQSQRPDATLVAGFRAWQKHGRQVRKGEKGIAILAPMLKRDEDATDPSEKRVIGFRIVHVFDVSQTDGDPIPTPEPPLLLEDDPEDVERITGLHELLVEHCGASGVTVRFDLEPDSSALGYYRPNGPEIAVRSDLGPVQAFKTLTHEIAHWQLHTGQSDRHIAELEAESTAFLVADALGIDTSTYSFAYLAGWAPSLEALMQAGEAASKAADTILALLGCAKRPSVDS